LVEAMIVWLLITRRSRPHLLLVAGAPLSTQATTTSSFTSHHEK
jgi:hypothetical protein